ncbi:MAG: S8 family serine peptidase, partial [Candidatus Parabeggiatoa sp.]|nr:S8 family serine peptidase [Candidatus Parabeggiatoa sp.]
SGYDIGAYEKTTLDFEQRRILRTINDVGYAYVIIGLHVDDYQPEGYYDSRDGVDAQRNRIATAQSQFVNTVSALTVPAVRRPVQNIDEFLNSVNTFTTVPQLFMKINRVLFETIIGHSLATNMWLNVADSISLSESTKIVGAENYLEQNTSIEGAWSKGYKGAGQYVIVLDSGVDSTHPALASKVVEEACFSFADTTKGDKLTCRQDKTEESRNTTTDYTTLSGAATPPCPLNDEPDYMTKCDHGTHVAGIVAANGSIKGVAKEASIIAIKIANLKLLNSGDYKIKFHINAQISALEYVYTTLASEYNIAAVNMSLNSKEFSNGFCDSDSRKPAIDHLYSYGIATIISSGNHGHKDKLAKPACISSAISVGATNENDDSVLSNSNLASTLDLVAPGELIESTVTEQGKHEKSGTSYAAPHVAGAWAILKQKLDATPNSDQDSSEHPITKIVDIIEAALKVTGKSIPDGNYIFPRIQIDKAVDALNYHIYMGIDGDGKDNFPSSQSIDWSGAAAIQMVLKYLIDSTTSQSDIYDSDSNDMTADKVQDALNLEVHIDQGPDGKADGKNDYNYGHLESDNVEDSIKKLVYWMDCVPNGGKNAPALVAIGDSYEHNWRVLRGFTTNSEPCFTKVNSSDDIPVTLTDVTVTGFLLNNPTIASTELGYYFYQNGSAFEADHQMINGKFRVVVEPPFSDISAAEAALANVELTLGSSKPNEALQNFLSTKTTRRKTRDGQNDIDLLSAVIDAIPGELLVNPLLQPLVKKVKYVRNFMVDNLDTSTQHAIFALSPNEGDTATILVEINPVDGSFASATWMAQEQNYPKISDAQAEQIAIQSANGNVQQIRRVWSNRLETSNFYFSYEVTFESGKIVYVNSKGEVIIEGVHSSFGYIHDRLGHPIAGVTVQVVGHQNTTTDETGYWEINGLTEGEYTLMASKTGYQFEESQDFAVGNNILRTEVKLDKPVSLLRITAIPQTRVVKQGQDLSYQIT